MCHINSCTDLPVGALLRWSLRCHTRHSDIVVPVYVVPLPQMLLPPLRLPACLQRTPTLPISFDISIVIHLELCLLPICSYHCWFALLFPCLYLPCSDGTLIWLPGAVTRITVLPVWWFVLIAGGCWLRIAVIVGCCLLPYSDYRRTPVIQEGRYITLLLFVTGAHLHCCVPFITIGLLLMPVYPYVTLPHSALLLFGRYIVTALYWVWILVCSYDCYTGYYYICPIAPRLVPFTWLPRWWNDFTVLWGLLLFMQYIANYPYLPIPALLMPTLLLPGIDVLWRLLPFTRCPLLIAGAQPFGAVTFPVRCWIVTDCVCLRFWCRTPCRERVVRFTLWCALLLRLFCDYVTLITIAYPHACRYCSIVTIRWTLPVTWCRLTFNVVCYGEYRLLTICELFN